MEGGKISVQAFGAFEILGLLWPILGPFLCLGVILEPFWWGFGFILGPFWPISGDFGAISDGLEPIYVGPNLRPCFILRAFWRLLESLRGFWQVSGLFWPISGPI